MLIQEDHPAAPDIHALLLDHLSNMQQYSPPESVHALAKRCCPFIAGAY